MNHINAAWTAIVKACGSNATTNDVSRAIKLVDKIRDHYLQMGQDNSAKARQVWLNDLLSNGMGGAHKYANQPNAKVVSAKQPGESMVDYLSRVRGDWSNEWACDDTPRRDTALEIVNKLRVKVLTQGVREELISKLTEENLDKTLTKFSNDTSTGVDLVTFKAIKALPPMCQTPIT